MKAEYRRELTKNYLVLEDEQGFSYENYRVRMLTRNKIPAFLECRVQMVDGVLFFYYDTSDTCPLSTVFHNHPVRRKEMEDLLRAIELAMRSAGTYFLEPVGVLLNPEYIFLSQGEEGYLFCYLPGREVCFAEAFRELSEFLLEHLDYGEKEGVVLGYGIYKKAQEEHACLEGLLALLSEEAFLSEEAQEAKEVFKCNEKVSFEKKEETCSDERRKKVKKKAEHSRWKIIVGILLFLAAGLYVLYQRGMLEIKSLDSERIIIETGAGDGGIFPDKNLLWLAVGAGTAAVLSGIFWGFWIKVGKKRKKREKEGKKRTPSIVYMGDKELPPTVYLSGQEPEQERKLLRMKDQEEFILTGEIFQIGKTRGKVELFLEEETISRLHARLIREKKEWYIQDMNSTNGTYVNGRRLKPSEKLLLTQGDEVRLADMEFLFL